MTTPVGSIKLDLKIDGSNLPAEMVRQIRAGLEPVLAEYRQQLHGLQRDYNQVGRDAAKSAAQQSAAAKATARAVDDVGDEYRQAARRATASAAEQVAANRRVAESVDEIGDRYTRLSATALFSARGQVSALDQVTRAIDQQTAAWGRLAAARTAAAATPTPGGPGGGGRGGGGGGSGGGGWGWHGGSGRGIGGFLTSPLGFNAMALGLGSWPAAATAVTNLTGAIQQLLQVGGLVPGMVGGIVSSVATLKIGFNGVEDAVKAAWEAAASGDPKDIKKAAEAMENLAPSAKSAVTALVGLRGEWQHLQRDVVQQNLFDGLDTTITALATKAMPTLEKELGGISKAWNGTFKQLGTSLGSDSSMSLLDHLFGNTSEAQSRLNKAIEPATHAIETLMSESSDFLPRLADGVGAVATRFDNWITKSVENGNLDKWINEGIEGATNFGNAFLNVGKIINDLTTAAGGGGGFLKWLNDATGRLHDFLSSTEGQEKLTAFFKEGREQLSEWGEILKHVWSLFTEVYDAAKQWTGLLLPALTTIAGLLDKMGGSLSVLVTGFLAFQSMRGIGRLAFSLAGLNGGLATTADGLATAATGTEKLSTRLGRMAGMTAGIAGLGLAIDGLGKDKVTPGSALEIIGGGALLGGSNFGVPGAIAGAGLGAAVAGVTWVMKDNAEAARKAAEAIAEYEKASERSAVAAEHAQNAMKSLNDALLESGGKVDGSALSAVQDRIREIPDMLGGTYNADVIKQVTQAIKDLGLSQRDLAGQVLGDQPMFDALSTNLKNMGPQGFLVQQQLEAIRAEFGGMQASAAAANPVLQDLAAALNTDLSGAAARVKTAFESLPKDVPVNIDMPNGQLVVDLLRQMNVDVDMIDGKYPSIDINDDRVRAADALLDNLGIKITHLPNGEFSVGIEQQSLALVEAQIRAMTAPKQILFRVATEGAPQLPKAPGTLATLPGVTGPGRADGGVLPGYSPGVDNLLVPMSGGEGVLIPEAVRGIGGAAAVYAINSMFRPGLSRRGYRNGGVIGFDEGGIVPPGMAPPPGMSPMAADVAAAVAASIGPLIGLLTEIRDVLKAAFPVPQQGGMFGLPGAGLPGGAALPGDVPGASLAASTSAGVSPATVAGVTAGLDGSTWLPIKGSKGDPLTDGEKALNKQLTDTLKPLTSAINESIKKGGIGKLAELGIGPDNPLAQQLAAARNTALSQNAGLLAAAGPVGSQAYNDVLTKNVLGPLASALNRTVKGNAYTGKLADYGIQAGDPLVANLLGIRGSLASAPPAGLNPAGGMTDSLAAVSSDMCGCVGQQMTGAMDQTGRTLLGGITSGVQGTLSNVAGDVIQKAGTAIGRGLPDKTISGADLINEGNLAAIPAALGYKVGDYSRKGGQGSGVITANEGEDFTAGGQLYSDTAALVDRSFTSLDASMKAGFDQLMGVMEQVRDQLVQIASNLASTAGGMAVSFAGGPAGATAPAPGKALGGPITGGIAGRDSVPIMAMPGEHMLTVADVAAMGGQHGVYAFRRALHTGGVRGFAAGGAVTPNVNATVGADFYGVSQIPILGAIIAMINQVLLSVIGVQIQARDTMMRMTDEFRQFRGDFEGFTAQGRLRNDTSGLMDRSGTSTEEAADERVKILKIVIKELIDYIVHNVIVPIAKATGKAAVAAGASAAGTAVSQAGGLGGAAGPLGGITSSLINAAGDAAVDVGATVFEDFAIALTGTLTDSIAAMLQNTMPGLVQGIFGQDLSGLFPTGSIMAPAMGGGLAAMLAGLLGGMAVFDDGGLATGVGFMPKATVQPERVLSNRQTVNHERLTELLDAGALERLGGNRTTYAPITVYEADHTTANDISDLLSKLDA